MRDFKLCNVAPLWTSNRPTAQLQLWIETRSPSEFNFNCSMRDNLHLAGQVNAIKPHARLETLRMPLHFRPHCLLFYCKQKLLPSLKLFNNYTRSRHGAKEYFYPSPLYFCQCFLICVEVMGTSVRTAEGVSNAQIKQELMHRKMFFSPLRMHSE